MSYTFDRTAYLKTGPGGAEDDIGGSIMSELMEGEHFDEMPGDYDITYYLSRKRFDNGDYEGPSTVIAIFKEELPEQRIFSLDYEQFSHDIDGLGETVEDWVEQE